MGFLSRYKGIIIGVGVIILVFVGYAMLRKPAETESAGLNLSVVNTNPSGDIANAKDPSSALVLQLLAIQKIVFDTKFFEDPVYRELVDQFRPLEEKEVGRPNPFLRIGIDDNRAFEGANSDSPAQGFVQTSATGQSNQRTGAPSAPSTPANPR